MYQIICIPDHLLSYFLGANDGASHDSNNIPAADIAVEQQQHQQPAAQMMPTSILRSSSQPNSIHTNNKMVGNLPNTSPSLESFVNARARDSSGALTNNTGTSMSMGTLPTPHSVHFYDEVQHPPQAVPSAAAVMPSQVDPSLQYRTSSQGSMHKVPSRASNASSNGSSSSSLAAMASAMALGNPTQVMMMQQKLQNRADQVVSGVQYQLNSNISPITPVNMMMGSPTGQEFMMLPPPTQSNNMIAQMAQNIGGQQHQQHLMNLQQNMLMAQAPISMNNQVPNNASQQQQQQPQTNFLPQMNPPNQPLSTMQTQTYAKGGFPDPQSVTSSVLAAQPPPQQQQYPELPQQPMSQPHLPQQQQQQGQQIQIGVNGQTIPINAVPTANGGLVYQIDSSVVPTAGLRYFTKAINDVSKPEEKKNVDPQVMAEKRAQRLARNRQSARNSRRRKKEHLQNLEAKVQKLQRELESEVRRKVSSMEEGLMKQREDMMEQWLANQSSGSASPDEEQEGDDKRRKQLALILQETGVNCQVRRAVVAHQYNMLRNTFLSPMNHYSVWMLLQSASFFTEAARQRDATAAASNEVVDKVNDRANSKAIGESIYNEDKDLVGRVISNSKDGLKTWPLYCHEITMTMEQEERIVDQLHVK